MKYSYLGPEGTFTESAVRRLAGALARQAVPFPSVPAAVEALVSGRSDRAVVPLENSVSGMVPVTLGELVAHAGHIEIDAQVAIGVTFALMAPPGAALSDVRRVISHPHAHGQCRPWVQRHLPRAELVPAASTAAAARAVARPEPGQPTGGTTGWVRGGTTGRDVDAAIAAPETAARYGLTVLASDIGTRRDAMTRFVSLRRTGSEDHEGRPTGSDRTALLVTSDRSAPGVLTGVLGELSARQVAITWIQSWPRQTAHGRHHFLVEVDQHIEHPALAAAVAAMRHGVDSLHLLGSYPYIVDRAVDGERTAA
ncbi:prephenate dehydratase [Streptomyces sp. NPDC006739]|uniref:prephenate dehydratase n=1 Tax=Streptomyces sp. NPDC006739 TaxID=3364763 RepID=UPI0036B6649C